MQNNEEILAAAKAEGIELSDEQLEAVSGGGCHDGVMCPYCNSTNTRYLDRKGNTLFYICDNCHREHERAF